MSVIDECQASGSWSKLIHLIGSVFNNPESLMRSFRQCTDSAPSSVSFDATDSNNTQHSDKPVQESPDVASSGDLDITVDLPSLRRAYQRLMNVPEQHIQGPLINALKMLSQTVEMELKYKNMLEREPNYINVFVIVMEMPMLLSADYLDSAFPSICKVIGTLHVSGQARLARIWARYSQDRLRDIVQSLQQIITIKVIYI